MAFRRRRGLHYNLIRVLILDTRAPMLFGQSNAFRWASGSRRTQMSKLNRPVCESVTGTSAGIYTT